MQPVSAAKAGVEQSTSAFSCRVALLMPVLGRQLRKFSELFWQKQTFHMPCGSSPPEKYAKTEKNRQNPPVFSLCRFSYKNVISRC
jgi:hypothetical protein